MTRRTSLDVDLDSHLVSLVKVPDSLVKAASLGKVLDSLVKEEANHLQAARRLVHHQLSFLSNLHNLEAA
jgi:hypothetical protein